VFLIRWFVVASPKRWTWSQLFETGQIRYRSGRHKKNYEHLKVGDVVAGYESSPTGRITALATVSKPFEVHQDDEVAYFELEPLLPVKNGPTYARMKNDPVVGVSQPLRYRTQGTLFALTEPESERLLGMLAETDPTVRNLIPNDQMSALNPPL
jgi:5-methylcytosine-specific restriction enzyme B